MSVDQPVGGPLRGLRILDLTRLFPFAYSTQMLADLGAEIVKVEPRAGDPGRTMPPLFHAANNGKKSVTLDIFHAEGPGLFRELCRYSDVVIDNYRPGLLAGLSLGPSDLRAMNPALVTCSATAYGADGPRARLPAHDLNIFGRSGAAMPLDGDEPVFPATPVVDNALALFLPYCVLAAVLQARATGCGDHIDLSMGDLALSMNATSYLFARRPDPGSDGLPWPEFIKNETVGYGPYQAGDGRWLTVGALEPRFWRGFLDALGRPDLIDEQFAVGERSAAIREELAAIIATRSRDEWLIEFERVGTCAAPVLSTLDAAADEQVTARGMVFEADGWTRVGFPARFSSFPSRGSVAAAPALGADNAPVYGQLGVGPAELEGLAARGVV